MKKLKSRHRFLFSTLTVYLLIVILALFSSGKESDSYDDIGSILVLIALIFTIISIVIRIIHFIKESRKEILAQKNKEILEIEKEENRKIQQEEQENLRRDEEQRSEAELAKKIEDEINNGTIKAIETNILLQKGEICYNKYEAGIYKEKNITERIGYTGLSTRIKIMKGMYYKIGSYKPIVENKEIKYLEDEGFLFVTNKRLIFVGNCKSENIKLDRIISVEMIDSGVLISRDTGSHRIYKFLGDYKTFPMYLSALLNKKNN